MTNWKCEVCGWIIGPDGYMREGGHHAAMEALRRERDEAVRDYDCLVKTLKERFPRRPDGSLPDWKVEDVLEENVALRAKLQRAREALREARVEEREAILARCPHCGGRGYFTYTGTILEPNPADGAPIPMPVEEHLPCEGCGWIIETRGKEGA